MIKTISTRNSKGGQYWWSPVVSWHPLPRSFFERDALALARALLGKVLVHRGPGRLLAARLVEVEAYRGPSDRAAHSFGGRRTARNEVMWGPAGFCYVYFVYGMHWCANVVAAVDGVPEAVLLRAAEPLHGLDRMRVHRGRPMADAKLLSGPANLCRALGIAAAHNGADLTAGDLFLADAPPVPPRQVRRSARIGVDYAGAHARKPWRLYLAGSPAVSGPPALRS